MYYISYMTSSNTYAPIPGDVLTEMHPIEWLARQKAIYKDRKMPDRITITYSLEIDELVYKYLSSKLLKDRIRIEG